MVQLPSLNNLAFSRRSSVISATSSASQDLSRTTSIDTIVTNPSSRPRSLSIPLSNPQKVGLRRVKQRTIFQDTGKGLFALPYELREQIYREVLGGHLIGFDESGVRIGDVHDGWPDGDRPGAERRGLKSWTYTPRKKSMGLLRLLMSCRQIYSEAISLLYNTQVFYFRNPLTHWTLSNFRPLSTRLQHIRVLLLDDTIADPGIVFSNRKAWTRTWRTVAKMTSLRVFVFCVDSLYPRAWTVDSEDKLLAPLAACTQVREWWVVLKWRAQSRGEGVPGNAKERMWRVDGYEKVEMLWKDCEAADLGRWVPEMLRKLQRGEIVGR